MKTFIYSLTPNLFRIIKNYFQPMDKYLKDFKVSCQIPSEADIRDDAEKIKISEAQWHL